MLTTLAFWHTAPKPHGVLKGTLLEMWWDVIEENLNLQGHAGLPETCVLLLSESMDRLSGDVSESLFYSSSVSASM